MSSWEPRTFKEFLDAFEGGRCKLVLHKWTRDWARRQGWAAWPIGFSRLFEQRVTSSEEDFWLAYKDDAFDIRLSGRGAFGASEGE